MWYLFFGYYLGGFLAIVIVLAVVVLLACWCCGVSVDSLVTFGEEHATLTCFHCGRPTQANRRTCQHCHRELQ